MKNIWLLLILIISFSCKNDDQIKLNQDLNLEPKSEGEIINHTYYSLAYSEKNEQALWVYYLLSPELINGTQSRTEDYRSDPTVLTGSATLNDYKGSGYDRGHLCPAADMKINKISMSETFYLSNMSPQIPNFNGGIWKKLEAQVRNWAIEYSKLYVVTGPIFKDNLGVIGEDEVTIPGYYYKVLFDGNMRMIGLILPNESSSKSLDQYVVTVDEIEHETGIDFFSGLDEKIENQLEGNINTSQWDFR